MKLCSFILFGRVLISSLGTEGFSVVRRQIVKQNRSTASWLPSAILDDIDIDVDSEVRLQPFKEDTEEDIDQQVSISSLKYDWDFVDKVYLITCPNADPGSVRLNEAKKILAKVGLLERVQVKEFDTDDEDRIRGCYASHISVLKDGLTDIQLPKGINEASNKSDDWLVSLLSMFGNNDGKVQTKVEPTKNNGDENPKCIMVLEYNLEFSGNLNAETLKSVSRYLGNDSGADIIHLSYIPYVPNLIVSRTSDKNIVGLSTGQSSALGTTAYIITEKAIETLIQEDSKNGFRAPIPDVMAEQFPESRFSAYPSPFLRAPKTKSLVNPQLDDLRELLFIPAVVSRVQSVLTMTGLSTNSLLFGTVIALLAAGSVGVVGVVDAVNQFISTGSYDGNLIFLVINVIFTTCSLGILAQGAALAPKPPEEVNEDIFEVETAL
jgi:GR25 family glycosyltransferase involved in LPS biosynthesis